MAAVAVTILVLALWVAATVLWLADTPSISSRIDLVLGGDAPGHVDLADEQLLAA